MELSNRVTIIHIVSLLAPNLILLSVTIWHTKTMDNLWNSIVVVSKTETAEAQRVRFTLQPYPKTSPAASCKRLEWPKQDRCEFKTRAI